MSKQPPVQHLSLLLRHGLEIKQYLHTEIFTGNGLENLYLAKIPLIIQIKIQIKFSFSSTVAVLEGTGWKENSTVKSNRKTLNTESLQFNGLFRSLCLFRVIKQEKIKTN